MNRIADPNSIPPKSAHTEKHNRIACIAYGLI